MEQLKDQFRAYFDIEEPQLNKLISLFNKKDLSKGDIFIHQGHICKELAFIKNGILRISTQIEEKDVTQWIATQGYYVTDLANFMKQAKSRWTITSLTNYFPNYA